MPVEAYFYLLRAVRGSVEDSYRPLLPHVCSTTMRKLAYVCFSLSRQILTELRYDNFIVYVRLVFASFILLIRFKAFVTYGSGYMFRPIFANALATTVPVRERQLA
jgi:hypothetical protein